MPALKLAKLLLPELNERAVSQRCHGEHEHAAMMTHDDVIRWLMKKDKTVRNIIILYYNIIIFSSFIIRNFNFPV
jgi:hypothetical protein